MTSYAPIDPVIDRWVQAHGLNLLTQASGQPCRFWYLSVGSECFQVAVEAPAATGVSVHAHAVDTDDDAELRGDWVVETEQLEVALVAATDLIRLWSKRARVSPGRR